MSTKKKRKVVAAIFGVSDPDDAYVDFLFERRHLETVAERGGRVPRYLVEQDNLEHMLITTLGRIEERDGRKISREVADSLIEAIEIASERRARCKANGAHV